jgi:hypothetical protein
LACSAWCTTHPRASTFRAAPRRTARGAGGEIMPVSARGLPAESEELRGRERLPRRACNAAAVAARRPLQPPGFPSTKQHGGSAPRRSRAPPTLHGTELMLILPYGGVGLGLDQRWGGGGALTGTGRTRNQRRRDWWGRYEGEHSGGDIDEGRGIDMGEQVGGGGAGAEVPEAGPPGSHGLLYRCSCTQPLLLDTSESPPSLAR